MVCVEFSYLDRFTITGLMIGIQSSPNRQYIRQRFHTRYWKRKLRALEKLALAAALENKNKELSDIDTNI